MRILRGIFFIFCLGYEILPSTAIVAMVPDSWGATVCRSSGLVPIPSTAESVPSTDITAYPSVQYKTASAIMCAGISNANKAVGYTYKDGICNIYGPGTGVPSTNVMFSAANLPPIESLEEVAQFKPTYSASGTDLYPSHNVVDGIIHVNGNFYHSQNMIFPWWLVDLEAMRTIHQVQIFTRQDCCSERLHDIEVRVGSTLRTDGNFSSYILMASYKGPYSLAQGHLICSHFAGLVARYVAINMIFGSAEILQLSEVTVYAMKP